MKEKDDKTGKLPAFQFYPADWRKDNGVQCLSFFERGVWFEILCLMHESEQRGKLLLNGKPMPEEALARLLGLDKQILTKTIARLEEYGVTSRETDTGILYNRRMVRDEEIRQKRIKSGKMGGNPVLLKQNSTKPSTKLKKEDNQVSKQIPTPSSSSSSSFKKETTNVVSKKNTSPPHGKVTAEVERIFNLSLPIHTTEILDGEQITNLDLWRSVLTDFKLGMTEAQLSDTNYRLKAVSYALQNYRKRLAELPNQDAFTVKTAPTRPKITYHRLEKGDTNEHGTQWILYSDEPFPTKFRGEPEDLLRLHDFPPEWLDDLPLSEETLTEVAC